MHKKENLCGLTMTMMMQRKMNGNLETRKVNNQTLVHVRRVSSSIADLCLTL